MFLPGETHGPRGLAGYSPWGRKESDNCRDLAAARFVIEVIAEGRAEFPVLNIRSLGIEGKPIILADYLLQIQISVYVLVVRVYVCACSLASAMSNSLPSCGYSPPGSSVHGIFQGRILE